VPKPACNDRNAARRAIRDAIRDHGPTDGPAVARRAFPDVNRETWKGWIAAEKRDARALAASVNADVPMPARGPGRPPLDLAPMPIPTTELKAVADGRRNLARSTASRVPLSFFDRFDELDADLAKVRSACIRIDPTGNERIVNPAALLLCVREGRANLDLAMKHSAAAWNIEQLQRYGERISGLFTDAVKELPEAEGRAAMVRLRALFEAQQAQMSSVAPDAVCEPIL
jgi:hypothetical protein